MEPTRSYSSEPTKVLKSKLFHSYYYLIEREQLDLGGGLCGRVQWVGLMGSLEVFPCRRARSAELSEYLSCAKDLRIMYHQCNA